MDWSAVRDDFPGLAKSTYLNTCSLGALSNQSRTAVGQFLDLWQEHGASAWYKIWLGEIADLRARFARLIGASPDEVAILPNVSSALAALASAVPGPGNVVSAAMDFPTVPYQWQARQGWDVRLAKGPDGIMTPLAAYEALMDDRTKWLATSHVFYTSGAVQDAKALAALARNGGALSILDAYQATGQLPTDVEALGVDAYITGGLKWLLGGPGICYLYVRRELHEKLRPEATGWFGHADPFAFDTSQFTPHKDARRFEAGTPSVAAVYAGNAGLSIIEKLGPAAIRRRTSALVKDLYERLADAGYELATPSDDDGRAGIVMVRSPDPPAAVKRLRERGFIVDFRPGRLRVSPYFYNTEGEIEAFCAALAEIAPAR